MENCTARRRASSSTSVSELARSDQLRSNLLLIDLPFLICSTQLTTASWDEDELDTLSEYTKFKLSQR